MTTNFAKAQYQEVIDLNTETDTVSVLGLHTPTGNTPIRMLQPFWDAFQKVRYDGMNISLVPAARLPADIGQVSYEAGEQPIDPRDLLNPILFHGCHGNDMGSILNQFYSGALGTNEISRNFMDSVEQNIFDSGASRVGNNFVEALYYKAMVDKTWKKAHPQAGFRKSGLHPLVYDVSANMQFGNFFDNSTKNPVARSPRLNGLISDEDIDGYSGGVGPIYPEGSEGAGTATNTLRIGKPVGLPSFNTSSGIYANAYDTTGINMFTSRLRRLGFIDTRQLIAEKTGSAELTGQDEGTVGDAQTLSEFYVNKTSVPVQIPKIFMGMILLPASYKAKNYFRMIITHKFSFAKYRGASMQQTNPGMVRNCYSYENWMTQIGANSKGVDDGNKSDGKDGIIDDGKDGIIDDGKDGIIDDGKDGSL